MDTACLLRNQLTRIGTEMWIKIFSPKVVGIEVVQRTVKRARRARLYYLRYVTRVVCMFLCMRELCELGDFLKNVKDWDRIRVLHRLGHAKRKYLRH